MAKDTKRYTIFQKLDNAINNDWVAKQAQANIRSYNMSGNKQVLFKTDNKEEYDAKLQQMRQDKYLSNMWHATTDVLASENVNGASRLALMYRDVELMDGMPEIGTALDIVAEESTLPDDRGNVVNVYSSSERVKTILEDLFVNRLNLSVQAAMVIRGIAKYGNMYYLLNIDSEDGVKEWRQLPVEEMQRIESDIDSATGYQIVPMNNVNFNNSSKNSDKATPVRFVWLNGDQQKPYFSFQIAHFRLLTDNAFLPYGTSFLHKARRHWRQLSIMEDMMLIYRLERSIERRVFKIFVGNIDDKDVPAFMDEIANKFKRTIITDPLTGQVDLRKNLMPVHEDTPIPLLDGRTIKIKELAKEFEDGKTNYVYSIQDDTHKVVAGKVVWCGKNYTAKELYKITLDDDTYMVMAGEHEIVMRNGKKVRADEVAVGDSVMPFYRKEGNDKSQVWNERYEKVYNPNSGKFEHTHRLVAELIEKENPSYNTVHHKDFNKYNNTPENLQWVDFNEHHTMHSQVAKNTWNDEEKRNSICSKLSALAKERFANGMPQSTKDKISATIKRLQQEGMFDEVYKENSLRLSEWKKNNPELVSEISKRSNSARGYVQGLRRYNESPLHKEHNIIRHNALIREWNNESKRQSRISKMHTIFDDEIWNQLRINILNKNIQTRQDLIDFINNNLMDHLLEINNSEKLRNNKKVSRKLVEDRIKENGFTSIGVFINAMKKNHKIKSIEIVGGADVYCMSVVGLNGEEDRHNFALRTIRQDGSWDINGCFVSNSVSDDYFIPTRDPSASSPIESLQGAQNLTAMDDIKYVQNKVLCALRIPMAFLNFDKDGGAGDGGNLAMKDIRFVRTVNRIQQAFLEELTKIATTHLYLLGFEDDLRNFTLTMNNPSTQAEQLEIETLGKKIDTIRNAVSDAGNGMPMMSMQRALKTVMKWSEKDIKENLQELRLEKALAKELEKTDQIIKRTTLFDEVDRIYGEPNAKYQDEESNNGGDQGGEPMGGGAGGGGGLGGGLDLGADTGDAGMEGEVPMDDAGGADAMAGGATDAGGDAGAPPMEARTGQPVLTEQFKDFLGKKKGAISNNTPIYKKDIVVSEMTASINKFLQEQKQKEHDE